ncbi:hypothetical protein [Caloramator sp. ALD01]|uniref:hypothetical protein n=1 Tax=Caloramator sp. ALD01 TaxID=1031288 RepID=UPI0003FE8252|nr:hypothetical protein [Caloramator sp. ALD01]
MENIGNEIKKAFVKVFNGVTNNKKEILRGYEEGVKELSCTEDLDETIDFFILEAL